MAVTIAPPSPTTADVVVISVPFVGCVNSQSLTLSGNTFTGQIIYGDVCFATPPAGVIPFNIGTLPTGSYNVVVHYGYVGSPATPPDQTGAFTVAQAAAPSTNAIPALDPTSMVALAVALGIAGLVAMKRRRYP